MAIAPRGTAPAVNRVVAGAAGDAVVDGDAEAGIATTRRGTRRLPAGPTTLLLAALLWPMTGAMIVAMTGPTTNSASSRGGPPRRPPVKSGGPLPRDVRTTANGGLPATVTVSPAASLRVANHRLPQPVLIGMHRSIGRLPHPAPRAAIGRLPGRPNVTTTIGGASTWIPVSREARPVTEEMGPRSMVNRGATPESRATSRPAVAAAAAVVVAAVVAAGNGPATNVPPRNKPATNRPR